MAVLVVNCNHWIGFHIVNALLVNDYEVDGIESLHGNENLSLFFGRNSSFTFVTDVKEKVYDESMIIGRVENRVDVQAKRKIIINPEANQDIGENTVHIKTPLLFGEWMPMNEKGIYRNKEHIPFNSEAFTKEAIYIKDFTDGFIQWLKSPNIPASLEVKSAKDREAGLKLDNSIYLRDNVPTKENVNTVLNHYQKYQKIYE